MYVRSRTLYYVFCVVRGRFSVVKVPPPRLPTAPATGTTASEWNHSEAIAIRRWHVPLSRPDVAVAPRVERNQGPTWNLLCPNRNKRLPIIGNKRCAAWSPSHLIYFSPCLVRFRYVLLLADDFVLYFLTRRQRLQWELLPFTISCITYWQSSEVPRRASLRK